MHQTLTNRIDIISVMSGTTLKRLSAPFYILLFATLLFQETVITISGQEESNIDLAIKEVYICKCVPYHICSNHTIDTVGTSVLVPRFQNVSCANEMEICCYDAVPSKIVDEIVDVPVQRTICGYQKSDVIDTRINGQNAKFGEFPWMMAILKIDPYTQSKTFICGGSLIHPRVVLTAIHSIQENNPSDLLIRAGEWDSTMQNEPLPYQESEVLKIIKHEKFSPDGLLNDVAMIILTQPFKFQENVGTICLPSQNYVFSEKTCYASGWGKDKFGKLGEYQNILKKVDLPIVPLGRCLKLLRKTALTKYFILHESFMCAGGEKNKDTCQGDGGSPLMCPLMNNPKQYYQAGIVAWGIGCNNEIPGVYVNVAKFRKWIDEKMAQENFNTSFYDPNYIPNRSAEDFDSNFDMNADPRSL